MSNLFHSLIHSSVCVYLTRIFIMSGIESSNPSADAPSGGVSHASQQSDTPIVGGGEQTATAADSASFGGSIDTSSGGASNTQQQPTLAQPPIVSEPPQRGSSLV